MELVAKTEVEDYWNCDKCVLDKKLFSRKCQHPVYGTYTRQDVDQIIKTKKVSKYSDDKLRKEKIKKGESEDSIKGILLPDNSRIDHCPMSHLDLWAYNLVSLIFWSEEIKIMPFSPNSLLDQSNVYVEARWAVVSQRIKIKNIEDRKKEQESKDKRRRLQNQSSRFRKR